MRYNPELNYHKRKKFLFKAWLAFLLLAILAVAAGIYAYYSVITRQDSNTEDTSTSQATKGYYASTVKVFRSPFFQLQLNNTWSEVPAESTPSKFVYRSLRANLIEHELVIYVNDIPKSLAANRVLPVNLKADSEFLPIKVSDHCIGAAGGSRIDSPEVILERVKFRCAADSTNYTVMVGLVGGSTILKLNRPDDTTASYTLYYRGLKATHDGSEITHIAEGFQTR